MYVQLPLLLSCNKFRYNLESLL